MFLRLDGGIGEPSIELKPIESEQKQIKWIQCSAHTHTDTINFIADAITNWIDDDNGYENISKTSIALWLNEQR